MQCFILARYPCTLFSHRHSLDSFYYTCNLCAVLPANRSLVLEILVNSLAPGKFEWNFRHVIFKQILATDGWGISCEIALTWMSLDFTDDQSTLVQVMAWCRQAASHYLSQCWPRYLPPSGVTRPQWVNPCRPGYASSTWDIFSSGNDLSPASVWQFIGDHILRNILQ